MLCDKRRDYNPAAARKTEALWSAFTLLRNMNFAPKRLFPLAREPGFTAQPLHAAQPPCLSAPT